ncbi:hypothetical protein ACS0TY_021718 [Phlomoides rotata]
MIRELNLFQELDVNINEVNLQALNQNSLRNVFNSPFLVIREPVLRIWGTMLGFLNFHTA